MSILKSAESQRLIHTTAPPPAPFMALYKILKEFEKLDVKHGRTFNGPRAELAKVVRPASASGTRRPKKVPRQFRPRPHSAASRSRSISRTTTTTNHRETLTGWKLNTLRKGRQKTNEYGREFYFLRISLSKGVGSIVDVSATDLTDLNRPTHQYRQLPVNKQGEIMFRRHPLASGAKTTTVISPVDDFAFVTSPAQLLGHTLRIRVVSTYPTQKVLVDTCCHFAGRNQGPSVLSSHRRRTTTTSSSSTKDSSREQKRESTEQYHKNRRRNSNRKTTAGEGAREASLAVQTMKADTALHYEGKKSDEDAVVYTKKNAQNSNTVPQLHNSSPNFKTRPVAQRRKKRGVMSPAAARQPFDTDASVSADSPKTELQNMRRNLSLNIQNFKEDISRKRRMALNAAAARVASDQRLPLPEGLKPSLTPYMKYTVDPDQLLKELAQVDTSGSADGLRGWSPKHSRRRPEVGIGKLDGEKAFLEVK